MAGTRAYRRDSRGRFAGSGGGSMTTYGKAGGFANSAFRARASATNQRASRNKTFGLGLSSRQKKAAIRFTAAAGASLAIGAAASAPRGSRASVNKSLGLVAKSSVKNNKAYNYRMQVRMGGVRRRNR